MSKRTVEIVSSFSGKISKGNYENEAPFFSLKEIIEDATLTDEEISKRQSELLAICYSKFKEAETNTIVERLKQKYQSIRFREYNGKQLASVTSILGWDTDFFMPADELAQYASQGTINHLILNEYVKNKTWLEPKQIPEAHKHIAILNKGNLNLSPFSGNIQAFLEKYPIEFISCSTVVFNAEDEYSGEFDCDGIPKGKEWEKLGVDPVLTLFDLKRSVDKIKNLKQLAAYVKASKKDYKQIVVIPVNDKTQQGFSKPTVSKDPDAYYTMFLQDRKEFKEKFGI